MRIARIETPDGPVTGEYIDGRVETEDSRTYELSEDVKLLPPCTPSTLYCAGRNFQDYLDHKGNERPATPHFFLKPPAAVLASGKTIPYPAFADGVGYAGELAAVIDDVCRHVGPDEALKHVKGYTIMNDVDALGQEGAGMKVFEGAAPLGPWIETDLNPNSLDITTTVGGDLRQEGNTSEMLFPPGEIISYLSRRITLRPGDVVAFGSPANPGEVFPGESVAIRYEGIGTLRNELGHPDRDEP